MASKWTKEAIQELLLKNDRAVERGVLAVYRNQMEDEKASKATKINNGIGFTGADARTMSYYAQLIERGMRLRPEKLADARRRMMKYWKQLQRAASEREAQSA